MADLSSDFEQKLADASSLNLFTLLKELIQFMAGLVQQRKKDRGSYLVLENWQRLPEKEQEEILEQLLDVNPHPSNGVKKKIAAWEPTHIRNISTLEKLANALERHTVVSILSSYTFTTDTAWSEMRTILLQEGQVLLFAELATIHKPSEADDAVEQVFKKAELEQEKHLSQKYSSGNSTKVWRLLHAGVQMAIEHRLIYALRYLRESEILENGNMVYLKYRLRAAKVCGEIAWEEDAIKDFIAKLDGSGGENWWLGVSGLAIEEIAESPDYFAKLQKPLFDGLLQRGEDGGMLSRSFLKQAVEMAVRFEKKQWQRRACDVAVKLQGTDYAYGAFEALEILAEGYDPAQEYIAEHDKPSDRKILAFG